MLWIVVGIFVTACQQAGEPSDQRIAMLQAIAGGFDENRAKFPHGTIRFAHEIGFSDKAEDARKGDLRQKATASGEYDFVDDGNRRWHKYSRVYPESDYKTHTTMISDSQMSTVLESVRLVSDGSVTLYDMVMWNPPRGFTHTSEILPGTEKLFFHADIPYDLGVPEAHRKDMGFRIRETLKERGDAAIVSVEPDVEFDGLKHLVRFRLRFVAGFTTYIIDPSRDWILLYEHGDVDNGRTSDTFYDDIRQIPGRGWLPFNRTRISGKLVHRFLIREADFEKVPEASDFSLEYPEPRGAVDAAKKLWYQEKRTVWDLRHLPSANAPDVKALKWREPPSSTPGRPSMPGEREATPWFLSPVTLVIALASLVGAFAYVRLRRR